MKTISQLYEEIYSVSKNQEPLQFISIVEKSIDEIIKSRDLEQSDINKSSKLLTDYGINLANTGKFSKAITYFNISANLFENNKKTKNKLIQQIPIYETLLLYRGVSYYNTRQYKAARKDLKRLTSAFPQNTKYKNWYNKTVNREMNVYHFAIIILLAISGLSYILFKENDMIKTICYSSMVGLIICSVIIDTIKRKRRLK